MSGAQTFATVPTRATMQRQPSKRRRQAGDKLVRHEVAEVVGEGKVLCGGEEVPERDDGPLYTSEIM